jgi:hypothetical protein
MMSDRPAWFRLPKESYTAYSAFKFYRGTIDRADEDAHELNSKGEKIPINDSIWQPTEPVRSLQRIANILQIPYATVTSHSSRNKWKDRARAYDDYVDKRSKEILDEMMRLNAVKWRERRVDHAEHLFEEAELLRSKALTMLSQGPLWQTRSEEVTERYPDGRVKTSTIIVQPVGWRMRDAALLARSSSKLIDRALQLTFGEEVPTGSLDDDEFVEPRIAGQILARETEEDDSPAESAG